MRTVLETLLGLAIFLGGFALLYFYISQIEQGGNIVFLFLSFVFVGVGIFLFFRVSNRDNRKVVFEEAKVSEIATGGLEGTLEKNNELVSEWNRTAESEDKLRLLKLRAQAAEKEAKSALS